MAAMEEDSTKSNIIEQSNKRRKKKSMVWEHFTIETIDADLSRACCKQCKRLFSYINGSKLAGTSHLRRHALQSCPVIRQNQEKNQHMQYPLALKIDGSANGTGPPRKRRRATPESASIIFSQDSCNHEIAKMIIVHGYPLNIVEHPGFIAFARTLQPQFNIGSFDNIQDYCVGVYLREKQSLLNLLGGISGRVNLSLDFWTSYQSVGYVFLMGHFIDSGWEMHRRILNIVMLPFPDSEVAFNQAVSSCLTDWNLENRLLTLVLDQSCANENVKKNLRGLLAINNPDILNGQLIIGSCFARVLSRLAQDATESVSELIKKVRDSVKHVLSSEAHEEKFIELKQQLQVPSAKNLVIDDQTRWDTTYHMLSSAAELKEVFACLDTSDPDYKESPTMDEWQQVEKLCKSLKILFDAADILTSSAYPTANIFFNEAFKIQFELTEAAKSEDPFTSNLTRPLQERFDAYWKECCLVLAMAAVMDPRLKMKLVESNFRKLYGDDGENWVKTVEHGFHELFCEYVVQALPPPTFIVDGYEGIAKTEIPSTTFLIDGDEGIAKTEVLQEDSLLSMGDELEYIDVYISQYMNSQPAKTELDLYLEETVLYQPQNFDVLDWWKSNGSNYPTLSRMACDILSIPVSTVPPDSVFDTARKKMDSYWSSLRPMTLEALICAKDWLQCRPSELSVEIPTAVVKMET